MNFFTSAKRVMAVLTIAAVPAVVFAYDFKEGNLCFEKLADGASVKVVKDDSYAAALVGSLTIPESVMNDGVSYSVAEIDYRAFAQCQALTSVVIPDSLKVVGGSAFYMCKALTSVTLGSSVEKIDVDAFYNTLALKSITLPNSLKTIGEGAFGYSGITSIEIPPTR